MCLYKTRSLVLTNLETYKTFDLINFAIDLNTSENVACGITDGVGANYNIVRYIISVNFYSENVGIPCQNCKTDSKFPLFLSKSTCKLLKIVYFTKVRNTYWVYFIHHLLKPHIHSTH